LKFAAYIPLDECSNVLGAVPDESPEFHIGAALT